MRGSSVEPTHHPFTIKTVISKLGALLPWFDMTDTRICPRCSKEKALTDFYYPRKTKSGYSCWCKQCEREKGKAYRSTPSGLYSIIKGRENFYHRAEVRITRDEFVDWYERQEKQCVYCDIPEDKTVIWKKLFNHRSTKLSVDRKSSSGDYVLDNMALCCYLCNTLKNNVLSYDEMRYIGQNFLKPKWQSYDGKPQT